MEYDLYDFDKTIYQKDCTVEFWKYCIRRKPLVLIALPVQAIGAVLMKLKKSKSGKSLVLSFIRFVDAEKLVPAFWKENEKYINSWFLPQNRERPAVVCSASPEFILDGICKKLEVERLVATIADPKTGKLQSPNCKGREKPVRLSEFYDLSVFHDVYSDSVSSDLPILKLGKNAFKVEAGGKLVKINVNNV